VNWVDFAFLIAVGSGALWGLGYGLIRVGFACGLLVASIGIACTAAFAIGPSLSWFGDTESEQTAAAFLIVFALMMVAGAFVNFLIRIPLTMATTLVSRIPVASKLNRGGGLIAGLLFGWVLLSVSLIGLQQVPVGNVGEGIDESTIASAPIGWVDRHVASIEISTERNDY
jgi:hypothetical protein